MKRGLLMALCLPLCVACSSSTSSSIPNVHDPGIDPLAWAVVPAGEFYFGQHEKPTPIDYDFEAMVTTVTNEQFAQYLNEALAVGVLKVSDDAIVAHYPGDAFHGGRHEEEIAPGDWLHVPLDEPGLRLQYEGEVFTPISGYENHPMVHVTWFGAKAYCEFNDGRLPTEVEWEKAARGLDRQPYPWGESIGPENANYYSSHDIFEKTFGKQGDTTPVGFYNGGTYDGFETVDSPSPYGLYDMAGNVWQWTGDVYEGQHYRYMRGGSKANYAYNLRVWTRNNAGPDYHSPSVGFRCVRDPSNVME